MSILNQIDINADVGEGIGNERQLFPYLSSCNIACGGHFGDQTSIDEMIKLAIEFKLKIGAHPSFPDKENFGRKPLDISSAALYKTIREQIMVVLEIAQKNHIRVHHVKPHGALYNLAAKNIEIATVIIEVLKGFNGTLKLYAPFNSVIANLAEKEHINVVYETFADRNYNDDGSLVSRSNENALITDEEAILTHVYEMITSNTISTINGNKIPIDAETICIHGDTPNAIHIARYLYEGLSNKGVKIR